jgi:hypothetical protein
VTTSASARAARNRSGVARAFRDPRVTRAVKLYRAGATARAVAAQLGVHESTVRDWLERAGVARRPRGVRPAEEAPDRRRRHLTDAEAARLRRLYEARPELPFVRTSNGQPGRATAGRGGRHLRDYLRKLNASGVPWVELGQALGLTKWGVQNIVRRAGGRTY